MATPYWLGTSSSAWATGGNWSTSSAPTNGDTVIFDASATASLTGGDFTASNTLAALRILSTFNGSFLFGTNGTPVKVGATSVLIGEESSSSTTGAGSGRINWDGSTIATTVTVYSTKSSSEDTGKEPVRIKAVNIVNKLNVVAGRVGVATDTATDVATFQQIATLGTQAVVNVGSGTTLSSLLMDGGTVNLNAAIGSIATVNSGTLYTRGSGAIPQLLCSGSADLRSTGTVSLLTIYGGGNVTMLNNATPNAITLVKMYDGSTFSYDPNVTTIPAGGIQLVGCSLGDVKINNPTISSRLISIV